MIEIAARNTTWLMRVLISANFEEDYNVENTVIARAECVQIRSTTLQSGGVYLKPLCYLTDERVNGALDTWPAYHFEAVHIIRPISKERKAIIVLNLAHEAQAIDRWRLSLQAVPPDDGRGLLDESDDKLQERIHLVKANYSRGASLEEISLALVNAARRGSRGMRHRVLMAEADMVTGTRMKERFPAHILCWN
ncbi:unnamed protein product [Peronospora farinosa]|uniref:Uncharacterized protein n=1 Tax=Peronospora farinosa TaxID=134698 RepID=A0AAV0SR64_9STRA|nr:unnamed protein product [Peronospora farinosa]CAI5704091.1 unnamed protein product [Peronospora farinosa]